MIENDEQLEQSRRVLTETEGALLALRKRIGVQNYALFEAMSESYLSDILRLRGDIDRYIGTAQVAEARAPFWMALNGVGLTAADVSTRLLSDWLERMRKAVLGVTEYLRTGEVKVGGRPNAALLAVTDLRLVALAEGSVKVGLRLPTKGHQHDLFGDEQDDISLAQRAIERLLEMAIWAQSDNPNPPVDSFPERDEAAVVADHLSHLVPSARGMVRAVSFSGSISPRESPIELSPHARPRLRGLIQILSVITEELITGTVREIDLDAQRVILRERGPGNPDMRCFVPDELMGVVEDLLDQVVQVRGTISSATPFSIDVVEIAPIGGE